MKVIYDNTAQVFIVINEETETIINTDDIVEARKIYLERMEWQFNDAVRNKLRHNGVYIVGKEKPGSEGIGVASAERIAEAVERTKKYIKE